ncbi:MAG: hypothetical protein E6I14_09960 [Chloroflexi bacterium]|nr:MAG: hypothetical protein E6I14_09960 [Chloroflexota bacterium]
MPRRAQLGGVFLVSAAGLLFQFAQTRLFSATLGYHLTFLVVSGALMGVAIGATAAATLDRERQRIGTSRLAIAAALAVLAALLVETQLDPLVVGMFPTSAAAYVLGVPPVLLASWIIVRSLRDAPAASGTIYAFDLAGAATGGLLGYLAIGTSAGSPPSGPRSVWSRCSVCGVSCSRRRGRGPSSRQARISPRA